LQTPFIQATENVATITEGQLAPFSGYLTKEKAFRSMLSDIQAKNSLKSELQICLENKSDPSEFGKTEWFAVGLIAGLLTSTLLIHALK
jgi:hypothetical protein